ncbi:MAG: glycosyltransferase [Candidatus Woesearchaeota archaeon]
MTPKISVIIPAHNEENYIHRPLDSLQAQDFRDFETIVIADSCSDHTMDVAKKYSCKIISVKTHYVGMNRNIGAREAKANILVFLDADVRVTRNYLRRIFEAVSSGYLAGRPKYRYDGEAVFLNLLCEFSNFLSLNHFPHTCFVTKKIFSKVNGYPEHYHNGEDMEFYEKVVKQTKCKQLGDVMAFNSDRHIKQVGEIGELSMLFKGFLIIFLIRKLFKINYNPLYPAIR